jgi:hypothetical protein
MDATQALILLQQHRLHEIFDFSGCICSSAAIQGVKMELACGKGGDRCVRVYTRSLDADPEGLRAIAEHIQSCVEGDQGDSRGPIPIRYCSHADDRELKCGWCGKKRAADDYLCAECKQKPEAVSRYLGRSNTP